MANTLIGNNLEVLAGTSRRQADVSKRTFGAKVGIFAKLFGCEHSNVSRPFTTGGTSYRTCLNCGARKQFNSETLQTYGSFYYPPVIGSEF